MVDSLLPMVIPRRRRLRPLLWWAYGAVAVTCLMATIYLAQQQGYRQSANDPQIQLAEDAASALAQGTPPSIVAYGAPLINIQTSLLPWIVVYDSSGTPVAANGQLFSLPPQPPKSLFDDTSWATHNVWASSAGKETRVTWQPAPDVRQAVVLVHYTAAQGEGFVMVGRSLSLTEERIQQLGLDILIAWFFTLAGLLIACIIGDRMIKI